MEIPFDPRKIVREALRNGGEFSEVFVEDARSSTIVEEQDKIEKVLSGADRGAGVRVIHGGKTVYGYSNDVREESLLELARTVAAAAKGGKAEAVDLKRREVARAFEVRESPDLVPLDRKIAMVRRGNAAARGYGNLVKQVRVLYRDAVQDVLIANSAGDLVTDRRVQSLYFVQVVAANSDGLIQTGYEPVGGFMGFEMFERTPPEDVAKRAAERALGMLRATKAPAGTMCVVMGSEAGGTMVHEAVGHGLEADLARNGLSVYAGKVGEKVASDLVTVVDDGTVPFKRGSFAADDEGTPAARNVLIERGVLKTYMYDRLMAMKEGRASTGNGRRQSYEHKPIVRMTNTLIAPGETDPAEIVRRTDRGLYVRKMGGGQVDTASGDFVFDVSEGYLIEGGELGEMVRGATLTGNGPEALRKVDLVGSDLGYAIGTCGKDGQGVPVSDAQPTIRITELVVGGEVR